MMASKGTRLVIKGYQPKRDIDYNEIFSPVVKITTIKPLLSIAATKGLHLEQLDVKTAFLHGDLKEDIHMAQIEGFQVAGKEKLVFKLRKKFIWFEGSTNIMVLEVRQLHGKEWVQ